MSELLNKLIIYAHSWTKESLQRTSKQSNSTRLEFWSVFLQSFCTWQISQWSPWALQNRKYCPDVSIGTMSLSQDIIVSIFFNFSVLNPNHYLRDKNNSILSEEDQAKICPNLNILTLNIICLPDSCITLPVCLSFLSHCSCRIQKSCLHISDPKWRVLQVTTWDWFLLHFSNLEQSGVQMQQLSHHLQGFIKINILSGFSCPTTGSLKS